MKNNFLKSVNDSNGGFFRRLKNTVIYICVCARVPYEIGPKSFFEKSC